MLPVPVHLDEPALIERIDPAKDVDALHPANAGRLAMRGISPTFVPCAPLGIVELLSREGIAVKGKTVSVIGNSNIVGLPAAWALRDAGAASVTVHHCTKFLKEATSARSGSGDTEMPTEAYDTDSVVAQQDRLVAQVKSADIIVVAVGCPEVVRARWVKRGAVVIDVGINAVPLDFRLESGCSDEQVGGNDMRTSSHDDVSKGSNEDAENIYNLGNGNFKVVGDVAAEEVSHIASAITPVPGGVGPMCIAALLNNTCLSASRTCSENE